MIIFLLIYFFSQISDQNRVRQLHFRSLRQGHQEQEGADRREAGQSGGGGHGLGEGSRHHRRVQVVDGDGHFAARPLEHRALLRSSDRACRVQVIVEDQIQKSKFDRSTTLLLTY